MTVSCIHCNLRLLKFIELLFFSFFSCSLIFILKKRTSSPPYWFYHKNSGRFLIFLCKRLWRKKYFLIFIKYFSHGPPKRVDNRPIYIMECLEKWNRDGISNTDGLSKKYTSKPFLIIWCITEETFFSQTQLRKEDIYRD